MQASQTDVKIFGIHSMSANAALLLQRLRLMRNVNPYYDQRMRIRQLAKIQIIFSFPTSKSLYDDTVIGTTSLYLRMLWYTKSLVQLSSTTI